MANRPTQFPTFCTDNESNREPLPSDVVRSGFIADQPVPVEYFNQILHGIGDWIVNLDGRQASTTLLSTLEPSIRLLGGGAWSYKLATNTLSWAADAFISYPGLADSANKIPAGSATVPPDSLAYVVTNAPFFTTGSTTSGSTTLSSVQNADQIQVGWQVSGAGIPSATTVTGIDSAGGTVTISAAATAAASGITLAFSGSGTLSVQVATAASFSASANAVVIARSNLSSCYVGIGTGQMRVHEQESKHLLEQGYSDIQRLVAGEALTAGQLVYVSNGVNDSSRTAGSVYIASAAAGVSQRAQAFGVVMMSVASGATAHIITSGLIPMYSGLVPGTQYYLSTAGDGSLTATAPTAVGQSVSLVGIAATASSLLLGGPANRQPQVIQATKYAPQQVYMGTYHRAAASQASGSDFTPFGVTAADGKYAYRLWTTGATGNVLRMKVNSVTGLPANVSLRVYRGNSPGSGTDLSSQMYQAGGAPFNTVSGGGLSISAFYADVPIAQGAFNAYDVLGLAIAFSSTTMEINAQAELVIAN